MIKNSVSYINVSDESSGDQAAYNKAVIDICRLISEGYKIVSAIPTQKSIHYILYKPVVDIANDSDQALEVTGDVSYNPETDSDVVALEPPIIPIMRSGNEQPDL